MEIVAANYGLGPNSVRAKLVELEAGITYEVPATESG